jgi:acetate kinase
LSTLIINAGSSSLKFGLFEHQTLEMQASGLTCALRHRGLSPDQFDRTLNHESGLLGISGISSDFRAWHMRRNT